MPINYSGWSQERLDNEVHDAKAEEASAINNAGRNEQIAYLGAQDRPAVTGNPKVIRITMDGGLIQDIEFIPADVCIEVWDFDVEGSDNDRRRNERGDEYLFSVWVGNDVPATVFPERLALEQAYVEAELENIEFNGAETLLRLGLLAEARTMTDAELRSVVVGKPMTLGEDDRCPHGMFWTGAGACPACEGSS